LAALIAGLLAWVFLPPILGADKSPDECQHKQTAEALEGEVGVGTGNYHFKVIADVAPKGKALHRFTNLLQNLHGQFLLPARWEAAGLEYDEIAPLSCGKNWYDSGGKVEEKKDTTIAYGSKLDLKRKASLYAAADQVSDRPNDGAELASAVYANLGKDGRVINLRFTSKVKDRVFTYTAKSAGESGQVVEMGRFEEMLEHARRYGRVERENWPEPHDGRSVIHPGEPASIRLILEKIDDVRFEEKRFRIKADGKRTHKSATGLV
jgi:hypothetical protein